MSRPLGHGAPQGSQPPAPRGRGKLSGGEPAHGTPARPACQTGGSRLPRAPRPACAWAAARQLSPPGAQPWSAAGWVTSLRLRGRGRGLQGRGLQGAWPDTSRTRPAPGDQLWAERPGCTTGGGALAGLEVVGSHRLEGQTEKTATCDRPHGMSAAPGWGSEVTAGDAAEGLGGSSPMLDTDDEKGWGTPISAPRRPSGWGLAGPGAGVGCGPPEGVSRVRGQGSP